MLIAKMEIGLYGVVHCTQIHTDTFTHTMRHNVDWYGIVSVWQQSNGLEIF